MTELVINSAIELLENLLDKNLHQQYWNWEPQILVAEKAATLKGSEEHLQGLKTDLKSMLEFLRVFSGRRNRQHLISQVRDMANDVGVIIDNFIFTKSHESESIRLNNFLKEIESIRSRFRQVNLQSPVEEEEEDVGLHQKRAAPKGPDDEKEVVVGLEKYMETLMQEFVLSERNRMRFMIYGMGGIGKTTLARQIYNHAVVAEQFDVRAWVIVSSKFNHEEVIRALIRQVVDLKGESGEFMEKMDVRVLTKMLSQHLRGKRCFIVLDDVLHDTSIMHVANVLRGNSSRMLITGRSKREILLVQDYLRMEHLSVDLSWQLFLKTVFIPNNKCPKQLEEIGRKIVKKCNGLPLAIKEAGRKLATMIHSKSEWEEFLETYDFNETIASLELSYHKLSPTDKSCFLHMSFFKEGTTIAAKRSIYIWNAAGMVNRVAKGKNMEDVAQWAVDALYGECIIIFVADIPLKSFYIDRFLHKVCITKAQEEIGVEILRNEQHCPTPLKPRHRAIYCTRERFNYSVNQHKHLLSLFFHGGGIFDASPSYWESFEQLRILDFEGFGLKSVPEKVYALSRLRYLGLRDNYIQELPHTLGRLRNLEVLDIADNFMIKVPNIIWDMGSLRHLYMSDIICWTPLKIDSLKYLQTLTYISINNWAYELSNLEKMTNLWKLGIKELDENSDMSKLFASLAKLKKLECLILRGYRFRSMPPLDDLRSLHGVTTLKLDGRLTRLPKFSKSIRRLTLVNSCLDEDPMPELLSMTHLCVLKLKNAYTGQEMVISQQEWSKSHLSIHIKELWHLRNLKQRDNLGHVPEILDICSCPYLDNISKDITCFGPRKLETLQMVTTRKIAKLIRESHSTSKTKLDIQP